MPTSITVDPSVKGAPIRPYWKKLTTAGRAAEGLREDWRQHLREVQREIGFEYIRFHGVLHDDMMIYHEDANGAPYYNWQYYDSLMDFLREVGLRPILELSFMPSALKSGEGTVFWWKGNITPPKDYVRWTGLIRALVLHSIDRYGLEEVLKWYFEVWNEPNLHNGFWSGDQAEYFKLYRATAEAVKAVDPRLKVGGPATSDASAGEAPWVKDFLAFCERDQVPVDFLSTHPYPNTWPFDGLGVQVMGYRDENSTLHDVQDVRASIQQSAFPGLEIHLTEWSSSPSPRDLVHDTAFMAPFIIQNNLKCLGLVDSLGFWVFSDVFEEGAAGDTLFHGGFGLINLQGLKKAAFYGYWYLAQLGDEMLASGPNYVVTRKGEDFQVLAWNYCHYTPDFAAGQREALTLTERYCIFTEKQDRLHISFSGGSYQVVQHLLDRAHGSALDVWLENGALENPAPADLAILNRQIGPAEKIERIQGAYERDWVLEPHAVLLLEFKKRTLG